MNRIRIHALLAVVLAACGSAADRQAPTPGATPAPTPAVTAFRTAAPTAAPTVAGPPAPSPTAAPSVCHPATGEVWVAIDAQANIFGAGLDAPPAPGGGGGGVLPPVVELPATGTRLVTFPCTGGLTDFAAGRPTLGAEGFVGLQTTDVQSYGGISGLYLDGQVMFLAGVFLADAPATEPAPERLDFTGNVDFRRLEPELGQTFFIGDGEGQTFVAPTGATRLYLGFVDGYVFTGQPGWYGNNRGGLEATVAVAVD